MSMKIRCKTINAVIFNKTVIFILFLILSSSANSVTKDDELYDMCNPSLQDRTSCFSYLDGFIDGIDEEYLDGMTELSHVRGAEKIVFHRPVCIPDGITYEEMADQIHSFLTTHPGLREYPIHEQAAKSLGAAFPCR